MKTFATPRDSYFFFVSSVLNLFFFLYLPSWVDFGTGCTWLRDRFRGLLDLERILPSFTEFYLVLHIFLGLVDCEQVLPSFTEFYRV